MANIDFPLPPSHQFCTDFPMQGFVGGDGVSPPLAFDGLGAGLGTEAPSPAAFWQ
jgi:hypothetical protein